MHNKVKRLLVILVLVLGFLSLELGVSGSSRKEHPYRYSALDIPVSLAAGSIRTPEFTVPAEQGYWVMVQVEKPLPIPFDQMVCMMGVSMSLLDLKYCTGDDPLLRADWTLWDGEQIADKGTIPTRCACKFTDKYIFKFLGNFYAEVGKKYVLELKFTKDGTALNAANPHLIIVKIGRE